MRRAGLSGGQRAGRKAVVVLAFAVLAGTPAAAVDLKGAGGPGGGSPVAAQDGDLRGLVFVLDPGHNSGNGRNPAAMAAIDPLRGTRCDTAGTETAERYAEAAFTWDVAVRLAALLRRRGATVELTRADDDSVGPCVRRRAEIANQARAVAAISIHADGGPRTGRGFHVIARPPSGAVTGLSIANHQLALDVRSAFAAGTGEPPASYLAGGGLVFRDDLGALNLAQVPMVLVECLNMRNSADARRAADPRWRQRAAEALAEGLARFARRSGAHGHSS